MAQHTVDSPVSAASNSPSPELYSDAPSSDASPISASPSLYMSNPSDEHDPTQQRRARSTPTRQSPDASRPHSSSSKGGCWTCRLRRKKCDEEREDASCKTCIRLRIECLGWGPKRPDWMRDKEKVAAYKAEIKEQLTRAGLIRGQPRATYMHGSAVMHHSATFHGNGHGIHHGATRGPSSHTLPRRNDSADESDFYRRVYAGPSHHPPGVMSALPGPSVRSCPTASNHPGMIMSPFAAATPYAYPSVSPTLPVPSSDKHISYGTFAGPSGPTLAMQPIMTTSPAAPIPVTGPAPTTQEQYTFYYFEHVRKVQYPLAGNALTNTLYAIVASEPQGAVANAVCALSSLHSTRMRIVQGLEPPETNPEQGMTKLFFDQALYHLINTKTLSGQYAETDAVAAVQLVSFSLLSGGWKDWTAVLEVACDWLAQTRIHEEQNPKLTLLSMSAAGRFAARTTMWIDIFSSITFMTPPRFLSLYRRLFAGGAGYWANSQQLDLRMDALTGCPDEAMLAIAEVSALAHWKAAELRTGSLSVRELIRRGDQIEQQLRARAAPRHWSDDDIPLDPGLAGTGLDMVASAAYTQEEARRVIVEIFREAAILYLHTVLSESLPGVPEISQCVDNMTGLLDQLPPSEYDRALVFPLFLMGCMTDDPMRHDLVKQRLLFLDDSLGNVLQVRTLMEHIWDRRTVQGAHAGSVVVDWRESLRNQWTNLLLI